MTYDDTDKAQATLIEAAIRDANVNGIAGYTTSAMTDSQYAPVGLETIGVNINRDLAIAIISALRQQPVRVPVCTVAALPTPIQGGIAYVSDGAGGMPCLAFSDGSDWRRSDTLAIVG